MYNPADLSYNLILIKTAQRPQIIWKSITPYRVEIIVMAAVAMAALNRIRLICKK